MSAQTADANESPEDIVILRWPSVKGRNYAVDLSSDLISWSTLVPEIKGESTLSKHIIWIEEPSALDIFYRVRKAPKSVFETNANEQSDNVDWKHSLSFEPIRLAPLFDGTDLELWKVPDTGSESWIVENGILNVKSGPERRESTLWTKKEYADFVMTFDFKFGEGTVDSGVFIRNDDQIQIGISGSLQRDLTASPFIPGTGYPVEASGVQALLKLEDWNSMRIEVIGPTYVTWLNDKKVMTYTSKTAIEKGPIGIQLHGDRDMAIDYRRIMLASIE